MIIKYTNGKFVQESGEAASVERGVSKIKYHIKYDDTTTDYDIALIKLDAPGKFCFVNQINQREISHLVSTYY